MEGGECGLMPMQQSPEAQHVHIKFKIFATILVNDGDVAENVLLRRDLICCNPWNPVSLIPFIRLRLYEAGFNDHEIERLLNRASRAVDDIVNRMKQDPEVDVISISLSMFRAGSWEEIADRVEEYNRALEAAIEESAPKPIPATKESIDALDKVKLKDISQVSESSQTCVVCLEELTQPQTNDVVAIMPCSHLFHEDCIVQWLNTSHLCPLCRFPMPTYADEDQ